MKWVGSECRASELVSVEAAPCRFESAEGVHRRYRCLARGKSVVVVVVVVVVVSRYY